MTEGTLTMVFEPDSRQRAQMMDVLTRQGFSCLTADELRGALPFYQSQERILTILNARLPWSESIELLQLIQQKGWPVLYLTAEPDNVPHLLSLFEVPCDVLVQPFSAQQLLTAAQSVLTTSCATLHAGALCLDTVTHRATLDGEQLTLTAQEYALLEALVKTPGLAVSRETLLRTAWGYQALGETRTVDVHIQRLRRKIGKSCIETVYKTGYKLKMA